MDYLREQGFDFHFYSLAEKDYQEAVSADDLKVIRLGTIDKSIAAAVLGTLPPTIQGAEFVLPEKSLTELKQGIADAEQGIRECDEILSSEA